MATKAGGRDARRMRDRRRQLKETQEEAAAAIGVSLSTYQRWERAEQVPHLRSQRRIAQHFKVPIDQIDIWFPQDHDYLAEERA
jgi:transcriptional regulator with XRE-family HTH domain